MAFIPLYPVSQRQSSSNSVSSPAHTRGSKGQTSRTLTLCTHTPIYMLTIFQLQLIVSGLKPLAIHNHTKQWSWGELWQPPVHNAHVPRVPPEDTDTFQRGWQLHVLGIQHILQVNYKMQSNCSSHLLLIPLGFCTVISALQIKEYTRKGGKGKYIQNLA